MKDFFSIKYKPLVGLSVKLKRIIRWICAEDERGVTTKKSRAHPWNIEPTKCPPPAIRITHIVVLFMFIRDDPTSCSSSDLRATEAKCYKRFCLYRGNSTVFIPQQTCPAGCSDALIDTVLLSSGK